MIFPTLQEMQTSREWCDIFYGYNHNLRIADGEFYDMTNMSGDDYPILSPRSKRGIYVPSVQYPRGLIEKDALCYIDGGDFMINKYRVPLGLTIDYDDEGKIKPKRLVSMGAYVIIMPDKKYVNTNAIETDYGDIEAQYNSGGFAVSFAPSRLGGEEYENIVVGAVAPTITDEMLNGSVPIPVWIDTSSEPNSFKIYSTTSDNWTSIATTYVKISAEGIGKNFEVNDGVSIEGIVADGATDLNASAVIVGKSEGYIIVAGLIKKAVSQTENVKVVRKMPELDFICESGNRLWGCRYGQQGDKIVNEIYASKLGDFKNWNYYQGTAADSYAVTVGTDGVFTGAVTHLGYPIFFKEGYMHKIYGNYPANYQVQTTACRGVQKGCADSIATVNEVLYYKARSGVVGYDGSLPQEISGALGDEAYDRAVAGYIGNKYYISMRDGRKNYHLFVYDTKKAMWHREDATEAVAFCNCRGDLYFIDYATNQIMSVKGDGVTDPNAVKWEAVTGIMGTDSPDKKYISRIDVRMKLWPGSCVNFYAEYDSSGEWEHIGSMTGIDLKSFSVPMKPKRCDHMRLKIMGSGEAKIFSICKNVEWGSDK